LLAFIATALGILDSTLVKGFGFLKDCKFYSFDSLTGNTYGFGIDD